MSRPSDFEPLEPRLLLSDAGFMIGDADGDGRVDDNDLSLLIAHWGQEVGWGGGDFSADHFVNDLPVPRRLLGYQREGVQRFCQSCQHQLGRRVPRYGSDGNPDACGAKPRDR